jgi:hypothetical protein
MVCRRSPKSPRHGSPGKRKILGFQATKDFADERGQIRFGVELAGFARGANQRQAYAVLVSKLETSTES